MNYLFYFPEKLKDVLHLKDNLAGSLQNLRALHLPVNYVAHNLVKLEAVLLSTSDNYLCSMDFKDTCLSKIKANNNFTCVLPFEKDTNNNKSVCSTYEEGQKALKEHLAINDKCSEACLDLNPIMDYQPDNYLLVHVRPKQMAGYAQLFEEVHAYHFDVPDKVQLTFRDHSASFTSLLGDFGSMAGIFLGISLLSFASMLLELMTEKKAIKKLCLIVFIIISLIYLFYLFIILLYKLTLNPTATALNFINTDSNFSISICSFVFLYSISNPNGQTFIKNRFHPEDKEFWFKWKDEKTIIDTLLITTADDTVNLLGVEHSSLFTMILENEYSASVCHTYDLVYFESVIGIDLTYKTPVKIFLHKSGELLYKWQEEHPALVSSTFDNIKLVKDNLKEVQISAVDALIKVKLESKEGTEVYQPYDKCVLSLARTILREHVYDYFFSEGTPNITLTEEELGIAYNFMKRDFKSTCKTSMTNLKLEVDLSTNDFRPLSSVTKDDFSLDINNLKFGVYPTVSISISEFTLLSQV